MVQVIVCYTEAVKTVDPAKALGKPHTLWLAFAKYVSTKMTPRDIDHIRPAASVFLPSTHTHLPCQS